MNNTPLFPDITGAASQAVNMYSTPAPVLVKRLRQANWRWDRSEGDNEKPSKRYLRIPEKK